MRPIIGMNCDVALRDAKSRIELLQSYAQAVELAGGIPILLPPTEDGDLIRAQVGMIGGLLLIGGADYDPMLYGSEPHPMVVPMNITRAAYDVKLADLALRRALPVLGICAGLQLVNILRGGSLHQHLPEVPEITIKHAGCLNDDVHNVAVEPGSRLAAVVGELQLAVNSTHHQAAARIGRDLRVCARSADGVVEALESTQSDEFLLCVQWHPERLVNQPRHLALFEALVQAADRSTDSVR